MKNSLLFVLIQSIAISAYSQTSVFNTTGNQNSAIGTTTLSNYSGYTGLTVNHATNGGFIDFKQNNALRANITGDNLGLSLQTPTGYGVHIWSNGVENMTLLPNGNLGVGTTIPLGRLQVKGTAVMAGPLANIDPASSTGNLSYMAGTGLFLLGWNRTAGDGETDFISNQGGGSNGGFAFFSYGNGSTGTTTTELMRIRGTGQVLIGVSNWLPTQSLGTNMLAVGGGILTESVTIKLQNAWPDYVFKPTYQLPSLSNVKHFIDENHHLPEIPSALEMEKNGQNLGMLNSTLVKKIEELTLYLIQNNETEKLQQKLIITQNEKFKLQEERIKKLEKMVSQLIGKGEAVNQKGKKTNQTKSLTAQNKI